MIDAATEELFTEATQRTDAEYVARERSLRDRGAATLPYLEDRAARSADPFVRFMADTLRAWIAGEAGP